MFERRTFHVNWNFGGLGRGFLVVKCEKRNRRRKGVLCDGEDRFCGVGKSRIK